MPQRKKKPKIPKAKDIKPLPPMRSSDMGSVDEHIRGMMDELVPDDFTPGLSTARVKQLKLLLSYVKGLEAQDIKEVIYPYIYEMYLKGFSAHEISMALGVAVSTIKGWLHDLRKCFKDSITGFDPDLELGKTVKFYDIISQKCLDIADRPESSSSYYRLAIQAQAEKSRMLFELGFYDIMKARAINAEEDLSNNKRQIDKDIDDVLDVMFTVTDIKED